MSTKIETSVEINAPVYKVRKFILDYTNHSNWNPVFVNIEKYTNKDVDELVVGDQLKIDVQDQATTSTMSIYPKVTVNNFEQFSWKGRLLTKRLFYWIHSFKYESLNRGTKTKLIHKEEFGGYLTSLLNWIGIIERIELSFDEMNEALKNEIEMLE
ncbi:hypothetical protein JA1_000267 [Spathaspora sp. JA1]|nr:hypothetical protein JA1_000267 [Spathaspora sp. JA1]